MAAVKKTVRKKKRERKNVERGLNKTICELFAGVGGFRLGFVAMEIT